MAPCVARYISTRGVGACGGGELKKLLSGLTLFAARLRRQVKNDAECMSDAAPTAEQQRGREAVDGTCAGKN
jgi:hypothetical protein